MKKLFLFPAAALLLMLSGHFTPLRACDFCGAFMGVTPFDNQSSIGFSHRYRVFNGYPSMDQTSSLFPSGAYRVSPAYSALHGMEHDSAHQMLHSDFESYKIYEMKGRWFIHPRVELNFILPFIANRSKNGDESMRVSGLGDMTFFAGWHVLERLEGHPVRTRLIIGAGVKVPTGKCDRTMDDGDRINLMMQPGTGSTDGFAYATYTAAAGKLRWGITSLAKLNGTNKYDEQVAASTVNNAFVSLQYETCGWMFLPQAQVYQEYTKGIYNGAELVEGTGMNMVLAGPGVEIYRNRLGCSLGAQFPVWQKTDEMNMKSAGRLIIGVSYSFNQQKYLLN